MTRIHSSLKTCMYYSFLFVVMLLTMFVFSKSVWAETIGVQLDDEQISFDVDPIIAEGTTLVQLRPLFETMGLELEWDHETKTITGIDDDLKITLRIDDHTATVDGQAIQLLHPARIIDGYTLVPIRFISEATGAEVGWNPYVPEVLVFTETYLHEQKISREEIQDAIDQEVERMKKEQEAQKGSTYKPADEGPVNLEDLEGMYVGYRIDEGGYECGGLCWDLYTFFADGTVVVGQLAGGGPETTHCEQDYCQSYSVVDGQLKLEDGHVYPIAVEDGLLLIDDVQMMPVIPESAGLTLSNTYKYYGYSGVENESDSMATWVYTLTFDEAGNFSKDFLQVGSLDGSIPGDDILASQQGNGTYAIQGNTLTLTYSDRQEESVLFFAHDNPESGELEDIQVGPYNFYVE